MGEPGLKLMIRMPASPRLRQADIDGILLGPGDHAAAGDQVLSIGVHNNSHTVRTPRAGRIVPLVSVGDPVEPGDPLFIVHLDRASPEEQNPDARALVPAEHAKWSEGITPDLIEPIIRSRKDPASGTISEIAATWGRPALAVGLYVLACFALLPLLHLFSSIAPGWLLVLMGVVSVAFGLLLYRLHRPDTGVLPRRTVQLVAASWVALAGLAIFFPPEIGPQGAGGRLASSGALSQDQAPLGLGAQLALLPVPMGTGAGVARGTALGAPVPFYVPPLSELSSGYPPPAAHGVQVRRWARSVPGRGDGAALRSVAADLAPEVPRVAPVPEFVSLQPLSPVTGLPEDLRQLPDLAAIRSRPAPTVARTGAPVQSGEFAGMVTPISTAMGRQPWPGEVADRAAPILSPITAILASSGAGLALSAMPEGTGAPVPAPDLAAFKASGGIDALDQGRESAPWLQSLGAPELPKDVTLKLDGLVFGEHDLDLAAVKVPTREQAATDDSLPTDDSTGTADALVLAATSVLTGPALPVVSQRNLIARDLLFLYVEDPRAETHPGLGDPWQASVSEELTEAIHDSRVSAVRDLVQVASWCPAAGGAVPSTNEYRTVWLDDRIRLLQVRVEVAAAEIALLERELPVFGDQAPGFFHNRLPLLGGAAGDDLLSKGAAYVRTISNRFMDPNTPAVLVGGHYFDDADALSRILRQAGCREAAWSGGDGPVTDLGQRVAAQFGQ